MILGNTLQPRLPSAHCCCTQNNTFQKLSNSILNQLVENVHNIINNLASQTDI